MPVTITREQHDSAVRRLLDKDSADNERSYEALLLAAAYRLSVLKDALVRHHGGTVPAGPFAGMRLIDRVSDGCFVPKLVGGYETPLHPHVERACAAGYGTVLNIGCAEGYYAVGFDRRMPGTIVHAFDIDPVAREYCREMAALNGVDASVVVGSAFDGGMFGAYADRRALVISDVEGAEMDLPDPTRFAALRGMDVIAELHDTERGRASTEIPARFAATHDIVLPDSRDRRLAVPQELAMFRKLDRLLELWEARGARTPWVVMTARNPGGRAGRAP